MAVQCLENVYELTDENTGLAEDHPMANVDLYEMFCSTYLNVSPERKAEGEQLKNEGNKLMKEEKFHEALSTYSR